MDEESKKLLQIIVSMTGSLPQVYQHGSIYVNEYKKTMVDIRIPKSLVTDSTVVKIAARILMPDGTIKLTRSYYATLQEDSTQNVYGVYTRDLPTTFVQAPGNQEIIVNVLKVTKTGEATYNVDQLLTTQVAKMLVSDSSAIDDEVVEPTQVEEIWAELGLKQDKTDARILTDEKQTSQVVVDVLNNHTTRLAADEVDITNNATNIAENSKQITKNTNDISQIKQVLSTGEDYIGTMRGSELPTDTQLTNFVKQERGRDPKNSDVIIFVWEIPDETDRNFKYYYNGKTWDNYEIPPIELAGNGTAGLIQGTYKIHPIPTELVDSDLTVDIKNGNIVNIYVENRQEHRQQQKIGDYLDKLYIWIVQILSGELKAGLARKAIADQVGNVINEYYLDKESGATKKFVMDYALPATFNNIYYIYSGGYSDTIPTEPASGVQFDKTITSIGSFEMFNLIKPLEAKYNFVSKNTYTNKVWLTVDKDCTVDFKLTTQAKKASDTNYTILDVSLMGEQKLTANTPVELKFSNNFANLGENELALDIGDTFNQIFEIITTETQTLNFKVYSSSTYPSSFGLDTQTVVIDVNYIGKPKRIDLPASAFTLGTDGVYTAVITQSEHGQQNSYDYLVYGQQNVGGNIVRAVEIDYSINDAGDITIYSEVAEDYTIYIAAGVDTSAKGVLNLINPTALPNIDFEKIGTVRIVQNVTPTALTLPNPTISNQSYSIFVSNDTTSTETINVNGHDIVAGQGIQFEWAGQWATKVLATKTSEIEDTVNNQPLDTTLTEINKKFDNVYTRGETNQLLENNIGKEDQVDFNAILQNNTIIATLDTSISDFTFASKTNYRIHIYLPLTTLTGELNNDYVFELRDKNGNPIKINTVFQRDFKNSATVGDMSAIQEYDVGIGYSWLFDAYYKEITEDGTTYLILQTDTITRESNPSMTGESLYKAINNTMLAPNTTVMCSKDYTSNGTKFEKGHTYLITGDFTSGELILGWTDITVSGGGGGGGGVTVKTATLQGTTAMHDWLAANKNKPIISMSLTTTAETGNISYEEEYIKCVPTSASDPTAKIVKVTQQQGVIEPNTTIPMQMLNIDEYQIEIGIPQTAQRGATSIVFSYFMDDPEIPLCSVVKESTYINSGESGVGLSSGYLEDATALINTCTLNVQYLE